MSAVAEERKRSLSVVVPEMHVIGINCAIM